MFSSLSTSPANPSFNSPSLSCFLATLADDSQLTENSPTLSPVPATLTGRVKHNPFVCHSYRKHPGSHLSSQRSFRPGFSRPNFLRTRHSLLSSISSKIRTSEKTACNSFRIHTSKTQHLKPFRMNTYEKTLRGATRGPLPKLAIPSAPRDLLIRSQAPARFPRLTIHDSLFTSNLSRNCAEERIMAGGGHEK